MRESIDALRASLRNPAICRLQLAFAGSATGQWACSTAVTVFSFRAGGAAAVSLQVVLRMLPSAFAAPLMSTFADRYPRVRVMVAADLARVVILAAMAVLILAGAPLLPVLILSGLSGVVSTAFEPAKAALLPPLAERPEDLTAANVVTSSIDSLSITVGPAIAGVLIAVADVQTVLWVTAATFLWSALLVGRIREPRRELTADAGDDGEEPGMLAQVGEGIRAVRGDARMREVLGFFTAQTLVGGALTVMTAAVALDLLDLGDGGLGLLNSAAGIGGIAGVLVTAALAGRRKLAPAFAVGMVLWGLPLVVLGLLPVTIVAVLVMAVNGVANTLGDVSGMTLLQRAAPDAVIGRVFGLLSTLCLGAWALGSVAAGALLELAGIQATLIATGALLPLLVLLRWRPVLAIDVPLVPAAEVALLRRVDIFAALRPVELERLAEALEPVHVAAGDTVMRQGEEGDRFYVIVSGAVDVAVDDAHVREQGDGEYFGEIALLHGGPRTATITARDAVELRALGRDVFLATVTGHGESAAAAEAAAGRRLAAARPIAVAG